MWKIKISRTGVKERESLLSDMLSALQKVLKVWWKQWVLADTMSDIPESVPPLVFY